MEVHGGERAVSCELARELLSAAADGEIGRDDDRRLDVHLGGCGDCRSYADRLAVLTRSLRLRRATTELDFVARVMVRSRPPRLGRGGWLRPALAWCGLVVVVQSIQPLVLGEVDGAPTHVARHVGASALALGVGFVYAAWRPHRAFGLMPLVIALLATTLAGALLDTVHGDRSAMAESAHIAEVVGMVLLWFVAGSPGWERLRDAVRSIRPGGGGVAGSTS